MTDMPIRLEADRDVNVRINGVIDVPRPGRVSGWAIDRSDPEAVVTVQIAREGRPLGEVRADAYRADLERGGIGTGRYGFSFDLDTPLEPGFEFTVTATAVADDGTSGELRRIGRAKLAEDPARRLAERLFEEVFRLRMAIGSGMRTADAPFDDAMARIEVVQARIEAALATSEPPQRSSTGGLVAAVGLSLLIGLASLGLGLWSLFAT